MTDKLFEPSISLGLLEMIVQSQFASVGTPKSMGVDFIIADVRNLKGPSILVLRDMKSLYKKFPLVASLSPVSFSILLVLPVFCIA